MAPVISDAGRQTSHVAAAAAAAMGPVAGGVRTCFLVKLCLVASPITPRNEIRIRPERKRINGTHSTCVCACV